MKIRCDRQFPFNFVFGITLQRNTDFKSRYNITKICNKEEFKDEVHRLTEQIKNAENFPETDDNIKKIASKTDVKIVVKKDGAIHEYGTGMYLLLLKWENYIFLHNIYSLSF